MASGRSRAARRKPLPRVPQAKKAGRQTGLRGPRANAAAAGRSGKRPSLSRPAGMPSLEGLEWGRLGMLAAGILVVVLVLLLLTTRLQR